MNNEAVTSSGDNHHPSPAILPGLKAGLLTLGVGVAFPLVIWAAGLKQWSFLPFLLSLPLVPGAGLLGALWLRGTGPLTWKRLAGAGGTAGALASFAVTVGFFFFPAMFGRFADVQYPTGTVIAGIFCFAGVPASLAGAVIGALFAGLTGFFLRRNWAGHVSHSAESNFRSESM